MGKCYFAKEPPRVEIRGGLVFVVGQDCEVAVTPHVMRRFLRQCVAALDAFDAEARVVPLGRH